MDRLKNSKWDFFPLEKEEKKEGIEFHDNEKTVKETERTN